MKAKTTEIYATQIDMLSVLSECKFPHDFCYAFVPERNAPLLAKISTPEDIDQFWKSSSGGKGRNLLMVPPDLPLSPRKTMLRGGGENYSLYPDQAEKCVILQEGGIFAQGSALISGRLAVKKDDDWSLELYAALSKHIKKKFFRVGIYYLGPEAHDLLKQGFRLTADTRFPSHSDLRVS